MEFLKMNYVTLEIYPKDQKPSTEENINEKSQWVSVAEVILKENPDILSENLSMFVDSIKKIFSDKANTIKNILKISNSLETLKEFDNCFIDENSLINIDTFIKKYNITNENAKIFGVLFNIITITDYVIKYVNEPENMNVIKFVLTA